MAAAIVSSQKGVANETKPAEETWLAVVERQVNALKFGSLQITVHEGRVVQIETSVKVRFDKP